MSWVPPSVASPSWVGGLFGWRKTPKGALVPNIADSANRPSVKISEEILSMWAVPFSQAGPTDPGWALEDSVTNWLATELPLAAPARAWDVGRKEVVSDFQQYQHLARVQSIIDADTTNTLRVEIGSDYLIRPDVTVGLTIPAGRMLHAAVSCKWTIRSDRVQNIRHEAIVLTRNRRGRQPHIIAITAEPLPSRIASIAQGTGEVDAVYHVSLDALTTAVNLHGTLDQREILDILVAQGRLFDLRAVPFVLAD